MFQYSLALLALAQERFWRLSSAPPTAVVSGQCSTELSMKESDVPPDKLGHGVRRSSGSTSPAGHFQKRGSIVAKLISRYSDKTTRAGRFMKLTVPAWLPAYWKEKKKNQLPAKFGLGKFEKKKSGARVGGITVSSRSLCTLMCHKQRGKYLMGLLPCRSIKGFEISLRWKGGSLESKALHMSVMKTKRKKNRIKKIIPSCCLIHSFLLFSSRFGRGKSLNRTLQWNFQKSFVLLLLPLLHSERHSRKKLFTKWIVHDSHLSFWYICSFFLNFSLITINRLGARPEKQTNLNSNHSKHYL